MTTKEQRSIIYAKMLGHCGYCGMVIRYDEMQVDHIIPKNDYVSYVVNKLRIPKFLSHLTVDDCDNMDNLICSCRVCNKWKSTFDLELFRKEISEQIKRLNDYSTNFRIAKKYSLIIENPQPIVFYFEKLYLLVKPSGYAYDIKELQRVSSDTKN